MRRRWTREHLDVCIGFIENINPQVTLQDLRDIFVSQFGFPDITVATLWNYLDGKLITLKLLSQNNQMRNAIFNKYKRHDYANCFLDQQNRIFFFLRR